MFQQIRYDLLRLSLRYTRLYKIHFQKMDQNINYQDPYGISQCPNCVYFNNINALIIKQLMILKQQTNNKLEGMQQQIININQQQKIYSIQSEFKLQDLKYQIKQLNKKLDYMTIQNQRLKEYLLAAKALAKQFQQQAIFFKQTKQQQETKMTQDIDQQIGLRINKSYMKQINFFFYEDLQRGIDIMQNGLNQMLLEVSMMLMQQIE